MDPFSSFVCFLFVRLVVHSFILQLGGGALCFSRKNATPVLRPRLSLRFQQHPKSPFFPSRRGGRRPRTRLHIHDLDKHAHCSARLKDGPPQHRTAAAPLADPSILQQPPPPLASRKGLVSPTTHNHLRASRWKDFGNYLFQLSCFQSRLG